MVARGLAAAIAMLAALLVCAPDGARARGGFGGHGFSVHGFSGAHAWPRHRAVTRHARFNRFDAFDHRHRRWLGFANWPWLSPAYVGGDDDVAPYGVAPGLPPFALYRPACRLETQTLTIARDGGGTREVTITRCLLPLGPVAAPDDARQQSLASAGGGDAANDRLAGLADGASAQAGPADSRACRVETRIVAAEGGGERTIRIHRC